MRIFSLLMTLVLVGASGVAAAQDVVLRYPARHHPAIDAGGMVVTQNQLASQVGARILADGGNAIDAAVAIGFALAVTLPRAGNLGGGGFMLVYLAREDKTIAIDYREVAPASASKDMFLGPDGEVDKSRIRFTRDAAGVPGTVAGMHHALSRYGTMRWKDVIRPAIDLAAKGVVVSPDLAESLQRSRSRLAAHPETMRVFYKSGGAPYMVGEIFKQEDLARSLAEIASRGPSAFYAGRIARKIVADMEANGGQITAADLAGYEVIEREPVSGSYRGLDVVSMPPPSSGGIHIVQMLNVLENFPLAEFGPGSATTVHIMTETMRVAYADRSKHLGDPDFFDVPGDWLMSKAYARKIADGIDLNAARPSSAVRPGKNPRYESPDTTHYSVMDAEGNAVANTYTLNFSFGSGITLAGTGILLNNEMDDFSAKSGEPNAFGLLGGEANAIEASKRPLSSMTPTMIFKNGKPYIITGSPGGSRIITTVLQLLVNVIDFDMNAADAVSAPRFHHQWFPDKLFHEMGFSADTLRLLEGMGHHPSATPFSMGSVQTIVAKDGLLHGAADPRRPNSAAIGPVHITCQASPAACSF